MRIKRGFFFGSWGKGTVYECSDCGEIWYDYE